MPASDVIAWAAGGGKTAAARRPVHGAARVARYLTGRMSRDVPGLRIVVTEVNGQPGILGIVGGRLLTGRAAARFKEFVVRGARWATQR